jgi:hypothetical protein
VVLVLVRIEAKPTQKTLKHEVYLLQICLCIGLASILTNTYNTFKHSRKFEGVRKFPLENQS